MTYPNADAVALRKESVSVEAISLRPVVRTAQGLYRFASRESAAKAVTLLSESCKSSSVKYVGAFGFPATALRTYPLLSWASLSSMLVEALGLTATNART